MRLNKFIAQSGRASRREADRLIEAGRVQINSRTIRDLGVQIDPIKDRVKVDGYTLYIHPTKSYIAFYKPKGVISSMSEGGNSLKPFVDRMGVPGLVHVGRLDKESEGLLLLTNDGTWAHRISHPSFEILKTYELDLDPLMTPEDLLMLSKGFLLEDGPFRADSVQALEGKKLRITLHDGRNRILRRALNHLGYDVRRLKRIQIGGIRIGGMRAGEWKDIEAFSI